MSTFSVPEINIFLTMTAKEFPIKKGRKEQLFFEFMNKNRLTLMVSFPSFGISCQLSQLIYEPLYCLYF
jgi:hypothetical protein